MLTDQVGPIAITYRCLAHGMIGISKTCRTLRNIAANCGICHLNLTADTAKCLAPYLFKPYTFALLRRVFHLTIVVDSARVSAKNIIRVLKSVQPHTLTFDQTSWQDREAFDIQAVLNACRVERLRVLDLDGIETISSACMRLVERCAPVLVDLYISTVDCQPLRWLPIGDYSPNMRVLNRMNIFHEVDSKIAAHLGRLISQSSITELTIVPDLDVTDGSTLLRATRGSLQSLNISVWLPEYAQYVPNLKVLKINELSWSSATSPTMPSDLTTLHLGPNGPDQQQQQQMLAKWLQNAAWMPKLSRISADIDFPQRTGLVDAPAETLQAVCVMRGIELSLTVDDDSQIWPMIPGL